MARWYEPTPEQEAHWKEWVAERPESVRRVAERFEPWSLYRMKGSGYRVTLNSFGETKDGLVLMVVNVLGKFNLVMFERQVFDVSPDDLTPCELPRPDEQVGNANISWDDVQKILDAPRQRWQPGTN